MARAAPPEPSVGLPMRSVTRRAIAGAGSIQSTGHGASRGKAVEHQRIMRAGEHDGVGAPPVAVDEAGGKLPGDVGIGGRCAVQRGFRDSPQDAPSRRG